MKEPNFGSSEPLRAVWETLCGSVVNRDQKWKTERITLRLSHL